MVFVQIAQKARYCYPAPSLLVAPYQLTATPAIDALLVHQLTHSQCIVLGGDTLADVDVVDAFAQPDADVTLATKQAMDYCADLFWSGAGDALQADLPASAVFHDFTIPKGKTAFIGDIANGANIDATIGSVLHSD